MSVADMSNKWSTITDRPSQEESRSLLRSRELAYQSIKEAILKGVLEPRERLVEERIGAILQLSRTPVREALAILEHEGLIESIPYKGLRIKPVTVQDFMSMYLAMGAIESAVARAAVPHITEGDVAALSTILDTADSCIADNPVEFFTSCRLFQQRLGEIARNPYLTQALVGIEERSDMYLIHSGQPISIENMLAAVGDRRRILAAVQIQDPVVAAEAAEAHATAIRNRWRNLYPNESP